MKTQTRIGMALMVLAAMLPGCPSTSDSPGEQGKGTTAAPEQHPGMGPMMSGTTDGHAMPSASVYPGMVHGTGPGTMGSGMGSTPHGMTPAAPLPGAP